MVGVEYDVDVSEIAKRSDQVLLQKFVKDGIHENMVIEYKDAEDCRKRYMCLRAWLSKSEYRNDYYLSARVNKLYVIKEREDF